MNYNNPPDSVSMMSDEVIPEIDEYRRHGFKVGSVGLLMPEDMICEVVHGLAVCPIPNSPVWLYGMVNLRGSITPILNIAQILNVNANDVAGTEQIFFKVNGEWIGVYADGLPQLLSLAPKSKIKQLPAISSELGQFVQQAYEDETQDVWLDCNLYAIFASLNQNLLSAQSIQ